MASVTGWVTRNSMPEPNLTTLKDIARATGVSIMTVSRVLRGAPKVSAEKRELVLWREARRLDYQPDPHLARMMQVVRGKKETRVRAVIAGDPCACATGWVAGAFVSVCADLKTSGDEVRKGTADAVEEFYLGKDGLTPKKLQKILHARSNTKA